MKLFGTVGKTLSLVAFVAILAGCSSSSDDGGTTGGGDVTQSGVFIDSVVEGLDYNCSTSGLSGTTDAEGKYNYKVDDTCTFSVGDIVLGTTAAKGVVTPLDLLTGYTYDEIVNFLIFLQSLDTDENLDNGINLPGTLTGSLDFTLGTTAFGSALLEILQVNDLGNPGITEQAALEHFYTSTNPYFQTTLTEEMFNDKMATFEGGSQLIVKSDATYEFMMVDESVTVVCTGGWTINATKLMLTQEECLGETDPDTIELDFIAAPATDVFFRVKSGGSEPFNYAFVKIESMGDAVAPAAPTVRSGLTKPSTSAVSIAWDKVPTATGYRLIYNKTGDFSGLQLVHFYDVNALSDRIGSLEEDTTYYFQLRAKNAAGVSEASNTYSAATAATPTAPAAPSNLTLLIGGRGGETTTLSWTDNADNETSFIVEVSNNKFLSTLGSASYAADTITVTEDSAPSGTGEIWFRVKASNKTGDSDYSNLVSHTY